MAAFQVEGHGRPLTGHRRVQGHTEYGERCHRHCVVEWRERTHNIVGRLCTINGYAISLVIDNDAIGSSGQPTELHAHPRAPFRRPFHAQMEGAIVVGPPALGKSTLVYIKGSWLTAPKGLLRIRLVAHTGKTARSTNARARPLPTTHGLDKVERSILRFCQDVDIHRVGRTCTPGGKVQVHCITHGKIRVELGEKGEADAV